MLAEELGIGFFEWDIREDTLWWSPGFYRLTGRDPHAYTPTFSAYVEMIPGDDRMTLAATLSEALEARRPFALDHRVLHADGAERVLELRGMVELSAEGVPEKVQGVARDVTEGRRRRHHLEAVERRLSAAQAVARLGSWEWDPAAGVLDWSAELYRLCGVDPERFDHTLEGWAQLVAPADRPGILAIAQLGPPGTTTRTWECRIPRPRRDDVECRIRAQVVATADGRGFKVIGTAQDITDMARTLRVLARNERLLNESQRLGRMGSWTLEPASGHVQWSPSLHAMHEGDDAAPTIVGSVPGLRPEDGSRLVAAAEQVAADGTPADLEFRTPDAAGEERIYTVRIERLRSAHGGVEVLGLVQDATGQLRQQEALLHQEALVRSAGEAIVGLSVDGLVTSWNPAAERIYGVAAADAIGRPFAALRPESEATTRARLEQALSRSTLPFDEHVALPDGSEREIHVSLTQIRDGEGRVVGLSSIARDVTDARRASRTHRETREWLDALLRHSPALVSLKDAAGSYLLASRSYAETMGIELGAFAGRSDHELFGPRVAEVLTRHDRQVLESLRPLTVEEVVPHRDGRDRVLLSVLFALANESGPYAIGRIATDITDHRDAEQAARANEAKTALLSRVSHELRTPLNAILGFAQLIEDEEAAGHITTAGRYLRQLIDELLDIARAETDELAVEVETRDLDADVAETLELLEPAAAERGVRLSHVSAAAPCPVLADPHRLRQIVLNVVGNAIKYSPPGGSVTVRARREGATVRLDVADDGPGIAPHLLETAFEPFHRLGAETRGIEGAGLGLALSRSFAEPMGATLVLDSDGRSGTTATLTLRAAPGTPPAARGPRPGAPAGAVSGKAFAGLILYIEDSESNIALMRRVVETRTAAELVVARDGHSGLAMARSLDPDLVLLDLNLPDMRGEDVLALLHGDALTRTTPVAVLSADASGERAERLCALGAHAYITKPIELSRLDQLLSELSART